MNLYYFNEAISEPDQFFGGFLCRWMYNGSLPGETSAELEADLKQAVSAGIRHLSVCSLMVEEGTPPAASGFQVDPDLAAEMRELTGAIRATSRGLAFWNEIGLRLL